jgi:hypothetical protein
MYRVSQAAEISVKKVKNVMKIYQQVVVCMDYLYACRVMSDRRVLLIFSSALLIRSCC